MDNPEEVLHILDEFAKLKPKDIPKELEDYLSYVARTGDPVYQWSLVKCLFREKLIRVITDFYESSALINPPSPAVDNFNYEAMKRVLLERLETFSNAPFTVQRLCELLTAPRKQYNRTDKFMRAIEKNILVVSTREPGSACRQDNSLSEPLPNGVSDGESLAQAVNNETAHLAGAQLNDSEDNALNEDGHVDISSVEAENSLATVAPKDVEAVSAEVLHNSEEPSDSKLISESVTDLNEDSCKTSINSEKILAQQNDLVENCELSNKSDSILHTIDSVESTVQPVVESQSEPSEETAEHKDKAETKPIENVSEKNVADTNEICKDKEEEVSAERNDDSSEAVDKPSVDESNVSCSSSDTTNWSNTLLEEQDGVSTTESETAASSSEVVKDLTSSVEAVDATSSEDSKEALPESSEVVIEKPSETAPAETYKDVGSSSDSLVSSENETSEEDVVGTTDKVVVEESSAKTSEEVQSQSPPDAEDPAPQEEVSEDTTGVEEGTVEESNVSETNVVEENIEAPIVNTEEKREDPKQTDVTSASETCSENEPKEALPVVSEEAMDVDEANSCHSTGAGAESEAMAVGEQIELMDDTE